jgi:hypothetical protein
MYRTALFFMESVPAETDPGMMNFMPYFKEMVSLWRQILQHPDVKPNRRLFSFDLQVIILLYVVGGGVHMRKRGEQLLLFCCWRREERGYGMG